MEEYCAVWFEEVFVDEGKHRDVVFGTHGGKMVENYE